METLASRLAAAPSPSVEELKSVPTFADLPADGLAWLASKMGVMDFESGEVSVEQGDPADHMVVDDDCLVGDGRRVELPVDQYALTGEDRIGSGVDRQPVVLMGVGTDDAGRRGDDHRGHHGRKHGKA